jgi:hypothetical protein
MCRVMNELYFAAWFYMDQRTTQVVQVGSEFLVFKLDGLFVSLDRDDSLNFMPA